MLELSDPLDEHPLYLRVFDVEAWRVYLRFAVHLHIFTDLRPDFILNFLVHILVAAALSTHEEFLHGVSK